MNDVIEKALAGQWTPDVLDALAERIVQRLEERGAVSVPTTHLVDATTLARELGVSREYVYRHKRRLGGHPLGDGPKARWRFDVETARAALHSENSESSAPSASEPHGRPRKRSSRSPVPLLPVAGNADTLR